jgi:hypothetical protein
VLEAVEAVVTPLEVLVDLAQMVAVVVVLGLLLVEQEPQTQVEAEVVVVAMALLVIHSTVAQVAQEL